MPGGERDGVVADVVRSEEGKQHQVGLERPDAMPEHQELAIGTGAVEAEVEDLELGRVLGADVVERPLEHAREGLLELDLPRLREGIAEHRDPERARRLLQRVLDVAKTRLVRLEDGVSLACIAPPFPGPERGTENRIRA